MTSDLADPSLASFDPADPQFLADPYPAFAGLREQAPVHWHDRLGLYVAVTHAACDQVLRHRGLGRIWVDRQPADEFAAFNLLHQTSLLESEPPTHTRLRRLVAGAFGRGHVERLRPAVAALADRLVAGMASLVAEGEPADLIEEVAAPLPVEVIAQLLGVPEADRPLLRPWSNAIVKMYEYTPPAGYLTPPAADSADPPPARDRTPAAADSSDTPPAGYRTPPAADPSDPPPARYRTPPAAGAGPSRHLDRARAETAEAASAEFVAYLRGMVTERRARPRADDLVSDLVAAADAGERLTDDEVVGTCVLLLMAGHEATVNVVGNGVLGLLRNRDQWRRLADDPGCVLPAAEELIRFDPALQIFERTALRDVEIGGLRVPAGRRVAALLGAANRDPAVFADPDRLDIARHPNPHLGFGAGIHFCLGAPLARIEIQSVLEALRVHLPGLVLAGEPRRRPEFVIRGLAWLPVGSGGSPRSARQMTGIA